MKKHYISLGLVLFLQSKSLLSLLALGECPTKNFLNKPFLCEEVVNDLADIHNNMKLHALAFLSTTSINERRMNFFAFEFSNLNCARVSLSCPNMEQPKIRDLADFKVYCSTTASITGRHTFALGYKLEKLENGQLKIWPAETYVKDRCPEIAENFSTFNYVIIYEPGQYLVVWGCGKFNQTHHEQGMWVLGHVSSNVTTILSLVLAQLELKVDYDAFLINSFSENCSCKMQAHDLTCFKNIPQYKPSNSPDPEVTTIGNNTTISSSTKKDSKGFYFIGLVISIIILLVVVFSVFHYNRPSNRVIPINN